MRSEILDISRLFFTNLFFFFLLVGCVNPSDEEEHTLDYLPSIIEINEFIAYIIELDNILIENKRISPILNSKQLYLTNVDFINNEDKKFMAFQDTLFNGTVLLPCYFKKSNFAELGHDCNIIDNLDFLKYQSFSVPLFTKDRSYAIINIEYHMGFLATEGYRIIFQKQKEKWKEISRTLLWVS